MKRPAARTTARTAAWRRRITTKPTVCHGQPRIRGSRVLVSVLLAELARDFEPDDVASEYGVTRAVIDACLAFAAEVVGDLAPTGSGSAA